MTTKHLFSALLFASATIGAGAQTIIVGNKNYEIEDGTIFFDGRTPYTLQLGNLEEEEETPTLQYITEDIKDARLYASFVYEWNDRINDHDTRNIRDFYCPDVVKYYASYCNPDDVIEIQQELYAKYPAYSQRIADVVIDPNHNKASFTKYVKTSPDAPEKAYPAYFYFDNTIKQVGEDEFVTIKASIIVESDEVTDANVKKKQEKAPHVGLNKRWTLKQLYVGNVNKFVEFTTWDFWMDDTFDYPLLDVLGAECGRDAFYGVVTKHYKGKKNIYYCDGRSSGAPVELYHDPCWNIIWKYDATTNKSEQFTY